MSWEPNPDGTPPLPTWLIMVVLLALVAAAFGLVIH